jgi:hypothetical protein
MEHGRPKRPGDTTGAGRVWTDQGLARDGGDQPGDQTTCVLVAGQTVGSGNKGIAEAESCMGGPNNTPRLATATRADLDLSACPGNEMIYNTFDNNFSRLSVYL